VPDGVYNIHVIPFLVQRIPRYVLLLRVCNTYDIYIYANSQQDLSKHTADTHSDFKAITGALDVMEQLARSINSSKSQKDNKEKVCLHMYLLALLVLILL